MSEKKSLGEALFVDIESNAYLNELHGKILYNYALKLFQLEKKTSPKEFELKDALRFTDLLSKSTHPTRSDIHKMWAQELIILLNEIDSDNPLVKLYAGSVFSSTGNHQGLQLINSEYENINTFEKIFAQFRNDYLTIPAAPEMKFFNAQKEAYDHLSDPCFSYSGPTSMGKSFIMRMFIKDEIMHGSQKNYALIVPTKALINEVRAKVIKDLENNLENCNYRVVTAASDIALEDEHNFILVLTPERLLYLLISKPDLQVDYLFIDEAHKLSGKNSRGPFYYKVVDMLLQRDRKPHFIFASPNIPNPQVYLRLMNDIIENNDESKLATTYSPVVQVKFLMDFINGKIDIYNERTNKTINIAKIGIGLDKLNKMLLFFEGKNLRLPPEQRNQTIVYYNGRTKAIAAARDFADLPGVNDKNDPELDSLSRDIMQEVHGDYYLAGMIKKGVAYHIGYLPASIRTQIEGLFQKGNITTMFCTSTLLEGVNLPADNLFITDNKIFRRKMNPVDFRNLIGRVGRISYNLYGNVFFVSEDKSVAAENYIDMLQAPVPEQELSITTNPDVLKKVEKKYIAEILKMGSSEIPRRRDDQSDESYVMMRKFGLILLRDIMEERDSLVHREFADFLTVEDEVAIREKFKESPTLPDDDINISVDQTKKLIIAIKQGLTYPPCNGGFVYADVIEFFNKLSNIFDWPIYEKSTLGSESKRKWYAVILCQWMEGSGLSYIMKRAIEYHKNHPDNFRVSAYQPPTTYNDRSKEHRNVVFADTLEVIENVILFSISNYFLRFSNEYKKVHNVTEFDNNWYEYVEFGTTNPLTILLQRNGFSRESATYIRNHKDEYVVHDGSGGELKLKSSLLICDNTSVMTEAASIKFNVPGLFLEEDA
ncbi:DEAD/DEAH box helicase [Enterococcus cecorum]|uniref:DEAD/DEAH box helicase n=1 Tax=Enterococcus cecorum TaxID=44008 RepID=UPI002ACAC3FC|nr:DEAD/DEAH box helicase [Enterococcus cecorum]MDZ5508126.1 DEAD/DEAH box helicase [Enterococcus cecorum]MDZ5570342.1 DEAD/DEAH box helicase [Enterococcus cecorum]